MSDGSKADITFAEKSFTVKDENGKQTVYEYTQNQYKLESGRTSYGIDIKNALEARIVFPFKGKTDRHAYVPANQFWKLPQ